MKKKTIRKIAKKLMRKPFHYIDTSVLVEVLLGNDEQAEQCKRYLNRIGTNKPYVGCISLLVSGEYLNVAKDKQKDEFDRLMNFFYFFFEDASLSNTSPDIRSIITFRKIKERDSRIEFMDAMHLACAHNMHASVFVTIDPLLVNNDRLEDLLGFRIRHPKDMI